MRVSKAFVTFTAFCYTNLLMFTALGVRFTQMPLYMTYLIGGALVGVLFYSLRDTRYNLFIAFIYSTLAMLTFNGTFQWASYYVKDSVSLNILMTAWDIVIGTTLVMEYRR